MKKILFYTVIILFLSCTSDKAEQTYPETVLGISLGKSVKQIDSLIQSGQLTKEYWPGWDFDYITYNQSLRSYLFYGSYIKDRKN